MKHLMKLSCLLIVLGLLLTMAIGCTEDPANTDSDGSTDSTGSEDAPEDLKENPDLNDDEEGGELTDPSDPIVTITLNGSGYASSKSGVVSAAGNVLTITKPGVYRLKGTLDNAQIRVLVAKTEVVELILAGVSITNQISAPLYIESADKVTVELAEGTENTLTDAKVYAFPEGEDKPNACLYSSEDLTIKGTGTLTVNASYNNGIGTKNDLKIEGGTITVTAINNAIKGNQSVKIEGGSLTLSGEDAIKSDSLVEGEGTIRIMTGATVSITAGDDGIQATSNVTIEEGASVTVKAADQDVNCDGTTTIADGALISK